MASDRYGVVSRGQLRDLGLSRHQIDGRIRRGQLIVIHAGVYAAGHEALSRDGHLLAAVLAGGPGAVLSHRSAGHLWGLLNSAPLLPEVSRPGSHRKRPKILVHRAALPPDEATELGGIPLTSPFRTLFDLAGLLDKRQLERAFNEVEVRQLWDRLSLVDLLERYPRRRGTVALRALLEARRPDGITRNDFEERFVAFLDGQGLPRPRLNPTLAVRGHFFEPDCMWERERLLAELDGRATHGTHEAFERDRRRDRILLAEGWRWARITWRRLHEEPEAIAADLRAALYP